MGFYALCPCENTKKEEETIIFFIINMLVLFGLLGHNLYIVPLHDDLLALLTSQRNDYILRSARMEWDFSNGSRLVYLERRKQTKKNHQKAKVYYLY